MWYATTFKAHFTFTALNGIDIIQIHFESINLYDLLLQNRWNLIPTGKVVMFMHNHDCYEYYNRATIIILLEKDELPKGKIYTVWWIE